MKNYLIQLKARALEKNHQWAAAHALYQQIASENPRITPTLAYRLGFTAIKNKQPAAAIPWLQQAIQKQPVPAHWCRRLAQAAQHTNNAQAALAALQQGGAAAFSGINGIFAFAQQLEKAEKYTDAAQLYHHAAVLESSNPLYHYRLGRALQQAENYPAAIAAYQQALAQDANHFDSLLSLGRCAVEVGHPDLIQSSYQRILALSHQQAKSYHHVAYHELGRLKAAQGEHASALDDYQQALALSPKYAASWYAQGLSQQALQQSVAALASFKQAAKLKPEHTEWQITLARHCGQSGPFALAVDTWAKILKAEPDNPDWLLQYALMLDMAGKIPEAQKAYARLLEQEAQDNEPGETEASSHPLALYCEALALVHNKQYKDAQEPFAQTVELMGEQAPAHWYFRYGVSLFRGGRAAYAEAPLQQAIRLLPGNHHYVYALAEAIRYQGRTWQEVEVLQQALDVLQAESNSNPSSRVQAKWCFELGEAQDKMKRFAKAGTAFAQANTLQPGDAMQHFREGYAWERAGQANKAQAAYALAQQHDKKLRSKTFGISVFHQAREFWPHAAEAYAQQNKNNPLNGELLYRLGMAHDRCYRWEQAAQCYRQALVFEPHKPDWHYRLGFVLERQEEWLEAARCYRFAAATRDKHTPYWFYRLGYVLNKAGEQEKACRAFLQTRPQVELPVLPAALANFIPADLAEEELQAFVDNYSQQQNESLQQLIASNMALHSNNPAQVYYKLGQQAERREMWQEAAELYQQAVRRSNDYESGMYYRLGYALTQLGQFEKACAAFLQTRILQRAHGVSETPLEKTTEHIRITTYYTEYVETLPLLEKTIVYESHLGKQLSCNPFAIFISLLENPLYKDYLHIWLMRDEEVPPEEYRALPNVIFVKRVKDLHLRYLATAEYLINNTGFPPWFQRREGQKYLNTWHGTPLKTLGKQQTYNFQEHKRTQRNFFHATHIISPNPHTTSVLLDSYDLRPIMGGKLAETGYPRIDLTTNASQAICAKIRRKLGISGKRPVVLYAPTWRGTLETITYELEKIKEDIQYLMGQHDCDFLFRGHHLLEKVIDPNDSLGCTIVDQDIDTNQLLTVVDVLITDYSSIFFDFLPTGKPIIYYIFDLEDYTRDRGMYFNIEEMPGYKCKDLDSLNSSLGLALTGKLPDESHHFATQKKFNLHDDGNATKRTIDFFFNNDDSCVVDLQRQASTRVLMNGGGFQRNGITTSLLNLLKHVDASKIHITMGVSPEAIESNPENMVLFERLPSEVAVIARHGIMNMSWEERWLRTQYNQHGLNFNDSQMVVIKNIFDREFNRIFGGAKFDVSVAFTGYEDFWSNILNTNKKTHKKLIYLHSDIYDEYITKYPEMEKIFKTYSYADKLVSVSQKSKEINYQKLGKLLDLPKEKFVYCNNVQDPERILFLKDGGVEEGDKLLFSSGTVFLNVGRLSPEKGHLKLIQAFAKLVERQYEAKLIILGDGPLKRKLIDFIADNNLSERVYILGYRKNPYPYIHQSDCFVLSSDHEAMTMSLMEAIILGKPFVATDISGNADIKNMYPENFVENSQDGLLVGMLKFLQGELIQPKFNSTLYNDEAIDKFFELIS